MQPQLENAACGPLDPACCHSVEGMGYAHHVLDLLKFWHPFSGCCGHNYSQCSEGSSRCSIVLRAG